MVAYSAMACASSCRNFFVEGPKTILPSETELKDCEDETKTVSAYASARLSVDSIQTEWHERGMVRDRDVRRDVTGDNGFVTGVAWLMKHR